jgi:cellulose synthase/poly-beta-1,6-N-acetylglucosamine synthase-like glycosyltransferase
MKYVMAAFVTMIVTFAIFTSLRGLDLTESFTLLFQMDTATLLSIFWYFVAFEIPRYTMAFLAVAVIAVGRRITRTEIVPGATNDWKVSVMIAGHNEAESLMKCLRSLDEQTRKPDEIIVVDDGSTDGMREILDRLIREKRIHMGLCNQVRCGKAAACNMGMAAATGDIIINLDADCSYDYDAIELLLQPFSDPEVGATCGNIGVRNSHATCITSWQAVEYLVSINLGKRALDLLDLVVCASGALGAFRTAALRQVGINEPGPGEDFDMTMRLRRAGWKIRFVGESWCMTDAPESVMGIIRQRRRWDRDTIRIRMRKFKDVFNPARRRWNAKETLEQIDWMIFNLMVTMTFPLYLLWLFVTFGDAAWLLLIAVALVYMCLDCLAFLLALFVARHRSRPSTWSLFVFALTFGLYNGYFMRAVRFYAYSEEWLFLRSFRDSYAPQRVLKIAPMY